MAYFESEQYRPDILLTLMNAAPIADSVCQASVTESVVLPPVREASHVIIQFYSIYADHDYPPTMRTMRDRNDADANRSGQAWHRSTQL